MNLSLFLQLLNFRLVLILSYFLFFILLCLYVYDVQSVRDVQSVKDVQSVRDVQSVKDEESVRDVVSEECSQ